MVSRTKGKFNGSMKTIGTKRLVGIGLFVIGTTVGVALEVFRDAGGVLGVVIGFFFFMVADRMEASEEVRHLQDSVDHLKGIHPAGHIRRMRAVDARKYVLQRLATAQKVHNTSFSSNPRTSPGYDRWLRSLVEAFTYQECEVREVMMSDDRVVFLQKTFDELRVPMKGSYRGTKLKGVLQVPLIEFILLQDRSGVSEVVFGWSTSTDETLSSDCFVSADPELVQYFLTQFRRFDGLGSEETIPSRTSNSPPPGPRDDGGSSGEQNLLGPG